MRTWPARAAPGRRRPAIREKTTLLGMDLPYTGRALAAGTCLFLGRDDFEALLA
jgi:hypothetical protein